MGEYIVLNKVKPNKYGDTNKSLRIRTSDLIVLKEAVLFYRKYLKREMKKYEKGQQRFHIIDDLHATSSYLLKRLDLRFEYDYKQLEPVDKDFYKQMRSLYKEVR